MIYVPRKVEGGYIGELYNGPPYKTCGASGWIMCGTTLTSNLIDGLEWKIFESIEEIRRATEIPLFEEVPSC